MQNTTRSPTNNDNNILSELGPTITIAHEIPVHMETARAFVPATAYDIPLKVSPPSKLIPSRWKVSLPLTPLKKTQLLGVLTSSFWKWTSTRLCLTFLNHEMETSLPLNE